MIPETPAFYKLAIAEIAKVRSQADLHKAEIDRACDEAISKISALITAKRESCEHDGVVIMKESVSGRPHDPDTYVCALCTSILQRPPISAEIVRVSQEELLKFFCK